MIHFILKYLVKPVLVFLVCSFLFCAPGYGQQKMVLKQRIHKPSHKRVIYGLASFYHNRFHGRKTANGETFSQHKFTCACNMLPLGTWIKVTNVRNGKSVDVRVTDRLHPKMRRIADLSRIAAEKLGYTAAGLVRVKVEVIGKNKNILPQ